MDDSAFADAIAADAPPPGFRPAAIGGAFVVRNGPLYLRRDEAGLVFGTRIAARHCNPVGTCHGGWLATIADMVVAVGARDAAGLAEFQITVGLTLDFLSAAGDGDWLEGRAQLLQRTRRLVFAQTLLISAGRPVLRASGTLKIGNAMPPQGEPRV